MAEKILLAKCGGAKFAYRRRLYEPEVGIRRCPKPLKEYQPPALVDLVKTSGLRGRGGRRLPRRRQVGFPAPGVFPRYLVCNADEGEPARSRSSLDRAMIPTG